MKKILHFESLRSLLVIVIALLGFSPMSRAADFIPQRVTLAECTYETYRVDGEQVYAQLVDVNTDYDNINVAVKYYSGETTTIIDRISKDAFSHCPTVKFIFIQSNIAYIEAGAFDKCSSLTDLYIIGAKAPEILHNEGESAALTIPEGCTLYIEYIYKDGYNGFTTGHMDYSMSGARCQDETFSYMIMNSKQACIREVINKDKVTYEIPTSKIYFPEYEKSFELTEIHDDVFQECKKLRSIVIPANIDSIGEGAFINCDALRYVKFDGTMPRLGSGNSFPTFPKLTQIVLNVPSTQKIIRSIYPTKVPLSDSNESFFSLSSTVSDEVADYLISEYGSDKVRRIDASSNKTKDSYDVIAVGDYNYWVGNYTIFKDGVELLFPAEEVSKLKGSITIPSGVHEIGSGCFYGYNAIESVNLNKDLSSIGMFAFSTGAKLSDMTIPKSVTNIYAPIFDDTSLPDTLIMENATPPALKSNYSYSMTKDPSSTLSKDKFLKVPVGATDAYREYKGDEASNPAVVWGGYVKENVVDANIIASNEPVSIAKEVKVWGSDGILHVSSPQRVLITIATFDGRTRAVKSEAGDQEFYLGTGIYIIRIDDITWKIKI